MSRFFHLFLPLLLLPVFCWGYLGEKTQLRAQMRVQNSPSIIQMNESTDSQGIVREVHWSGPLHPNFHEELSTCYDQLAEKLKAQAHARGAPVLTVSNDYCTISIGGHLGHVYGKAQLK